MSRRDQCIFHITSDLRSLALPEVWLFLPMRYVRRHSRKPTLSTQMRVTSKEDEETKRWRESGSLNDLRSRTMNDYIEQIYIREK